MTLGMPSIEIIFKQKAVTAIARSAKGIVALVLRDDTAGSNVLKYERWLNVDKTLFTEANAKFIEQCFLGSPNKVIVIKLTADADAATLAKTLDALKFNWLCFASGEAADQEAVVSYVKSKNMVSKGKQIKGLVYNATVTDDMHIVNLTTSKARWADAAEDVDGWQLLPRLTGILAGLPFTRSATYYQLDDLEWVQEPEDMDAAVDGGQFFLFNDEDGVRVARAVNSLKTIDATHTEDMCSIAIVESMDIILEDIHAAFKAYIGKYKNKYDYQALFISAVNSYFRSLAKDDILDNRFDNHADVDIEAQREAWRSVGKDEAADWDDITVKNNTFKRKVFLAGNIKILDAMEDMTFNIEMM
nr:MAG TPA: tail protein [Caudoviricetes sp.]